MYKNGDKKHTTEAMKNFTSVHDVDDIEALLQLAKEYKANPYRSSKFGRNKKLGCLFLNPSMRTRLSTQIAAQHLGMEVIIFNAGSDGWALEFGEDVVMNGTSVEHIKDAAPVLGAFFDVLAIRTFPSLTDKAADYAETVLQQFIKYANVPVISLESATLHPLQSLADVFTISESLELQKIADRPKVALVWAPHIKALPQCVANSFAQWINAWNKADFTIANPVGYDLSPAYTNGARLTNNLQDAITNADFIYIKNWSSYNDYGAMPVVDEPWMLALKDLELTNQAKIMHCLPVRRNVEVSAALLDSENSIVTTQAGNRVWAAQAVLSSILKDL